MPTLALGAFSKEALISGLASEHAPASVIASHSHVSYLFGYLDSLKAKSLIVESPYVDGDYLDDYTAYYARCFTSFGRWTKRLHFFDETISEADFARLMGGVSEEEAKFFQEYYLGFIVARPLPEAIIGRTVLKTYDPDGRRFYPATKDYEARICGITLLVRSLAFQEQDTVLAACATVALWSCFHQTSHLFQTSVPTPASITRTASQAAHYGRPIPSSGLQVEEICTAIRGLALEPELVDLRSGGTVPLASLLYGYLEMGLPVLLVIELYRAGEEEPDGLHAVTLTGYSLQSAVIRPEEVKSQSLPPLKGRRIDKVYGHDDQIGPFARLALQDAPDEAPFPLRLETSWKDEDGKPYDAYPYAVIVPVYNKIRLRFIDILQWVTSIDALVSELFPEHSEHEWDIHLLFSNAYKAMVRVDPMRPPLLKREILSANHPRFWWLAALTVQGQPVLELLFDATGIARSLPLTAIIWLSESFAEIFGEEISKAENSEAILEALGSEQLFELLTESVVHRAEPFKRAQEHASR